ncbi:Abortive infection C-terminus [Sulfitobacter marinus]|uniref:Abortive infection C-terminus n=1 Tax=Sulfitobacter marinus TaxID=394264 RepID=A0A1I6UAU3_9RHOB|nr:Abortive infection C-terminus [Sulfitobacter marinus]
MGSGCLRNEIGREVRQNIFDAIDLEDVYYGGRLSDTDFLSRLFDLDALPSYDQRYPTAAGDIYQHCENNSDWEKNWVFSDARFGLLSGSDEAFLKFICEMIHPLVRTDKDQAIMLRSHFDEQLNPIGWQLFEKGKIAGRARYGARRTSEFHSQINRARTAAKTLSSNWMQTEITRINEAIDTDPALAIGTAKDLVESCCKAILDELGVAVEKTDDLPTLSKKMCRELGLLPDGISAEAKGSEIIRRTLSNLTSITKGIAELRGLYGSGHGRDGKHRGLKPRHARLAAASAIAFVDFVTETYLERTDD